LDASPEGRGSDPGPSDAESDPRPRDKVEACRKLIVRIFGETLPEITRSYRLVPDGMAKIVIREYLSSEKKQDTMVNFFLNSKVFQKLTGDEKKTLTICDSEDFLRGLEPYIELPKVRVIRDILRENQPVFEEALQRGKRRAGWM
jgi:hypothetical protein